MARKRGNNEGSISKRSDGRYMAQITIGRDPTTGKPRRVTFYGKTREDVAEKLNKALYDKARGILVEPHRLTLGGWLDTWLWEYKKPEVRPKTFESYEMLVRRHLKPSLGHIPLRDLRPEHIQRFCNEKRQQGLSARTVEYLHTLLYGALNQAEKNSLVVRNVSTVTTLPRKVRKDITPLTFEQVRNQLLPALKDDRLYAAFFLAFTTGLRRGELLALRWKDIDFKSSVLHVRQALIRVRVWDAGASAKSQLVFQQPKTTQSRRTLPISPAGSDALKHHRARQAEEKLLLGQTYQDHGLVFCHENGQPLEPQNFVKRFYRLFDQTGLPRIRFHDARHTFATWMLALGESPKTVQTMLGHANIGITLGIYSHVSLDLERRAAAKLDAALSATVD